MRRSPGDRIAFLCKGAYLFIKGYAVNKIKYSGNFYRILDELDRTQWYGPEALRKLQDEKLRDIIEHAYANVPYYHRLFDRHGLKPSDIRGVEDIKKIPVLNKETLRRNQSDLVARNINRRMLVPGRTTGTTGMSVNALRSRLSVEFENAILWRQRKWAGLEVLCRSAAVWGTVWNDVIISPGAKRPPFWRRNHSENQILLSYYHMSDDTLPAYFRELEAFKPEVIEAFPSTLLILAGFLRKEGKYFPVKAITTSSEVLYDSYRREIEDRFKTRIFDRYGQAERVVAATECSEHKGLHVNPEYGVLEIIKRGRDASAGEDGEIIGTGLNNYGMPLIRYRTGDMTVLSKETCPCGRKMDLLNGIQGRIADRIITPEGRTIPGSGLMSIFNDRYNIWESQIIQKDRDRIDVRIVKEQKLRDIDSVSIITDLKKYLGEGMKINIDIVSKIEDKEPGKRRWIISEVKNDENQ